MPRLATILVVEDDPAVVRGIARGLRAEASVESVGSVVTAIEFLDRHGPKPLVVDVRLPDGSGFDVVAYARGLDTRVAALAMSGDATFGNRAHALHVKFLQKPVEIPLLVQFVRDAFHPKRIVREAVKRVPARWLAKYDLTPSEHALLNAAAVRGIARRDLADALGKSEDTVKTQIRKLLAKTGHELLSDAKEAMLREALAYP